MNTIALELQRVVDQTVDALGNILFDKLILQKGSIEYNLATGEISINKPGRYMVNWVVTTQSSVGSKDISFAIKTLGGDEIVTSSPLKVGEVVGFGIVQVDTVPTKIVLVSKENNQIQLSKVATIKAHLTVGELLESDEGPVGVWNSAGMQMLSNKPEVEMTIMPGQVIPFDNSILQFNGVSYSQNTINILEPGYYLVSWEINLKPSQTGDVIITLEDTKSTPNVYGKIGSRGNEYTTLTGTALVMASNIVAPYSFDLRIVNRSGVPIIITPVSNLEASNRVNFVSSLTVVKVGDLYWS